MSILVKEKRTETRVDPRVRRTRKLLMEAFLGLMKEQSFRSITIQGIAARAGVNRATFYSHFEDKYDLLNAFVCEGFEEWVSKRVSSADGFSRARLRLLVATVFEFLAEVDAHCAQATQLIEPMFASAVQQELNALLLSWLRPVPPEILPAWHLPETAALVWSWAIFGAGIKWSREGGNLTADEMAAELLEVLLPEGR